jgi:hypothetical protein
MGANGDAGYLTSSSAPDFLVDADGSDTVAPICDYPRASTPSTSSRWLKSVPAEANADDLPFGPVVKLGALGASVSVVFTRSLAAEQGHFDN